MYTSIRRKLLAVLAVLAVISTLTFFAVQNTAYASDDASTYAAPQCSGAPNYTHIVHGSYQTVIGSRVHNRWACLYTYGGSVTRVDVRMLGRTGNVVWEEKDAMPTYGKRNFWCGDNVYALQVKAVRESGIYPAPPTLTVNTEY